MRAYKRQYIVYVHATIFRIYWLLSKQGRIQGFRMLVKISGLLAGSRGSLQEVQIHFPDFFQTAEKQFECNNNLIHTGQ